MATDYLAALRDYHSKGGKDINEFLNQHTTQPVSAAARIAAADAASRITGGAFESSTVAPAGGNVITRSATGDLPPGAEGSYYGGPLANPPVRPSPTPGTRAATGDLPPGAEGSYYGGPLANPPTPSPTPKPNIFGTSDNPNRPLTPANSISGTRTAAASTPQEVPWWQKSSFTPEFQSYIDETKANQVAGPLQQGVQFAGTHRGKPTFRPAALNYNTSSSI